MGWTTAPYVPTPPEIVRKMLKLARVGPGDVVYDLGCGDGRILITAVRDFRAEKAVGYEIKRDLYKLALSEVECRGLRGKIRLVNGDLFEADLSEATVVTLYLNGSTNQRLKPKLERETRGGTRIVSRSYQLMGWRPTKREGTGFGTIYLYTIPESLALDEAGERKKPHGKMTAVDAENRGRQFIRHRRPRVKGIRFRRTWREGDFWMVEGEFWFKRAHFFTAKRSFRLRVSAETGEVKSYEEARNGPWSVLRRGAEGAKLRKVHVWRCKVHGEFEVSRGLEEVRCPICGEKMEYVGSFER